MGHDLHGHLLNFHALNARADGEFCLSKPTSPQISRSMGPCLLMSCLMSVSSSWSSVSSYGSARPQTPLPDGVAGIRNPGIDSRAAPLASSPAAVG